MADFITVKVDKIRKDSIELRGKWNPETGFEYYLTPDNAEAIINGYEKDIVRLNDKIIALNTEIAELRLKTKLKTYSIPTGNIYGGGYGD